MTLFKRATRNLPVQALANDIQSINVDFEFIYDVYDARTTVIALLPEVKRLLTQDIPSEAKSASNYAKGTEIEWNSLYFRSHSEMRIAQALDRAKVIFYPNCKARLGISKRENREPDFLVGYEGKWGILEVDGEPFHPPSRTVQDHERDRLFKIHGIKTIEHFDAAECFENADEVVKKFLYLLKTA